MSEIKLRPHHALCIHFFEGKGYSEDFTEHMSRIIEVLDGSDPDVTVTPSCDIICEKCPHNKLGICEAEEKVRSIDSRVMSILGLSEGDTLSRSKLYELAYNTIIARGRLKEVCRDCMWLGICDKEQ